MKTNTHKPTLTLALATLLHQMPAKSAHWLTPYDQLVTYLEKGNNRWGMQAFMLAVQGNILAPAALLIIQYHDFGYQDYFAGLLAVLFLGVLVANIALLSVRTILNLFLLNLALHVGLIGWHLLH